MNKQKQKKSIEERYSELLTEFVTYFVKEFEAKLHAYYLILEGEIEKAGQYSDKFSGIVGQGIGGTLAGLIGLFFGVPAVASLGAAGGKELAEKIGHAIGSGHHRKKVIRLNNLVNRFQNDKANFRRELVEAGFDIFQSYEIQFMNVTTDQGPKKAMQLLARDATNRLISYNGEEIYVERKNVIEGVIQGKSKIEAIKGVPIASGKFKTPGFKVETSLEKRSGKKISEYFYLGIAGKRSKSGKKWSTASMFEKVGLVREKTYYEKKDGTSKVYKYGYRRILNYEDWIKLKDEYNLSKSENPFKSYRYISTFEDSERQKIIPYMLAKINLNDKNLMENRIRELMEEVMKEVNSLKEQKDLHIENSKILEDLAAYLKTVNVNGYLNKFEQYFEKNEKDHGKIIEFIETGREENIKSFNQLKQNTHNYNEDNKKEHRRTQELIKTALVKPQSKRIEESIWFDVKDPVNLFTGRKKELNELDTKIQRNPNQSTVITRMTVISGLGGLGKTELARRYVQIHGEDFDNIIWINSENEATLIDSFSRLAKDKLQIETRDENGKQKNIKYIVEEVYTFLSKRKSILIFDNVEKNDDFIKILHTFRHTLKPPSAKPYILITSRNREWETEVLNLSVLTLHDAIDLVKKRIDAEEKDIKTLVEILQCFPLAIQQAMAYIEHQAVVTTYDISKYIQEYEKKTQDLLDSEIFKGIDNDYEKTTFTTWKITIDKITKHKDHGELASDILNIISYLAPENIKREMFLLMANRDETKLTSAVRMLVTYSMVNAEEKQNILSIHRLVQEVTRLELKNQNQEEKVLKKVYDLIERNFPYGSDKMEDYEKRKQQLPHLEAFTTHLNQWIRCSPEDRAMIEKAFLLNMLTWIHNAYLDLSDPKKQKELLEKASAIEEKYFGSEHFERVPTLANLGNAYGALGDPQKQKDLLERALAIQEKHFGSDHFEVAIILSNLGNAYGDLGDPQKQKELLERALAIEEKHFGSEHFKIAPKLSNLGNAYGELGDPQKQKELLERALGIQEQHFGSDHFKVAVILSNLGTAYGDLGDHKKKKELLERALAIEEKHFGSEHFEIAPTLANLGNAYGDLSDIQKQKDLLERALAIEEKYFGSEHFEVAATLSNLGNAYGDLGDPQKGKELLERALAIKEKHFGSEHFHVASTLATLSNVYYVLGDPQKRKELLERTLAIQEKHFGSEHFQVAPTLASLGSVYGDEGDFQKQKDLLERALAIAEKHFGSEHFEVAKALTNLGNAYGALGDPQKQKDLLERALAILEKHFGSEHFHVAVILSNLGTTYGNLGDPQRQKELLERALAIKEKHFGSEHFEIAPTLASLGNAYGALGDPQKQKELLEKALAIKEKCFGSDHFKVAVTLTNLSNAYGDLGDLHKQKELLERTLAIREKCFGSDHLKVAVTLTNLSNTYGDLADHQKRKTLLERALAIQEKHFGSEHFEVAKALTNLGNAYGDLGDPQKQEDLLERALAIKEKHFGSEHFKVAIILSNLGTAYGDLGDPQKKKELLERDLAVREKCFGSDHFKVAVTQTNISNAYGDLGDPHTQKDLLEIALAIREKCFGSDHLKVAVTLTKLSNTYGDLADHQKRKTLLERALAIQEKHFGSEHFEVAKALTNLGNAYGALGDPQKQKDLLEIALAIQEKYFGSEHFEVAATRSNLGNAYGDLGDPQKQKELLERALAIQEKHFGSQHFHVAVILSNL